MITDLLTRDAESIERRLTSGLTRRQAKDVLALIQAAHTVAECDLWYGGAVEVPTDHMNALRMAFGIAPYSLEDES